MSDPPGPPVRPAADAQAAGQSEARSEPEVAVADAPERLRYEARVAGAADVAVANYRRHGGAIIFTHTEVPPAQEGQGVGAALARYALEDVRRQGLAVLPQCRFIAGYIRRHPEFLDLVPEGARKQYGLP
jgi:uncharacterized protein